MANQYYELIQTTSLEIDGKIYQCQSFKFNLEGFLKWYAGRRIWIYSPSITTNEIRAIVI